jgi:hypothetical protein
MSTGPSKLEPAATAHPRAVIRPLLKIAQAPWLRPES